MHFKMDQQWICILATLSFYNKLTAGDSSELVIKDGYKVEVRCRPSDIGTIVMWFRVLDKSGIEFLASYTNNGIRNKGRDSGTYSCATLKNNELKFGPLIRLTVEAASKPTVAPTAKFQPPSTALPCACENLTKQGDSMSCNPIIVIPLAGSCGILLLFILIIVVYCNRVRTRRCPHHYKKRPMKKIARGKQQQQQQQQQQHN
ncbi:T-cell surface glycoprotein CD8 alpha chain isoform X4 [Syngnathoides biaculeatus]|uniref:T-cell surface glycoprotein CD8 alpha chain isoform X4 n=1 Tax=Syngnathoides biaculeatus TaxID=300417 RepID=UPI002ADDD78E|nr:T-cell surface glycoprotein CD8 alpha chain isoform X4 [Syngnathoides biaculeatus]